MMWRWFQPLETKLDRIRHNGIMALDIEVDGSRAPLTQQAMLSRSAADPEHLVHPIGQDAVLYVFEPSQRTAQLPHAV